MIIFLGNFAVNRREQATITIQQHLKQINSSTPKRLKRYRASAFSFLQKNNGLQKVANFSSTIH